MPVALKNLQNLPKTSNAK